MLMQRIERVDMRNRDFEPLVEEQAKSSHKLHRWVTTLEWADSLTLADLLRAFDAEIKGWKWLLYNRPPTQSLISHARGERERPDPWVEVGRAKIVAWQKQWKAKYGKK